MRVPLKPSCSGKLQTTTSLLNLFNLISWEMVAYPKHSKSLAPIHFSKRFVGLGHTWGSLRGGTNMMVLLEPSSLNFKNLGTTNMTLLYRVQSQVCSQVYIHMCPTLWLWLWGGNEHDGLGKTIVFRWFPVMDLGANKVANYTWFSSFPSSPSYFIFRPQNYPVLPLGFPTFPRKSEIWGSPICDSEVQS